MLYYLVVCAATGHTDGHAFSDFMGYCMALRERRVEGDFLSCFPLEEHFMWLQNEHNPPIDVIKSGKTGPSGKQTIYTYPRQSFLDGCLWFTQVGAHELLSRVEEWIVAMKGQTQEGDVVNIIFEGRRKNGGVYCIGDRKIHPSVFCDPLSGFKTDTSERHLWDLPWPHQQSNSECPAFISIRTVAGEDNLPGVPRGRVSWKIRDHEEFMTEQLKRNLTPSGTGIESQLSASKPLDGMSAVEEMVFRDKVDVLYDPKVCARRRLIKWPSSDALVRDTIYQDSQSVTDSAKVVLDSEISRCDPRGGYVPVIAAFNQLYV